MFIARQPIFNNELQVYGYELLFRKSDRSMKFDGLSSLAATAGVVGGLYELGFSQIIDDKRAFVNFDADFLMRDISELIEPNKLIIEILENVVVDDLLVERIKKLKALGYKIALDDFVERYEDYPLVPYADIIKFDLMLTPLETIGPAVYKALSSNKIILAEKVETEAVFLKAKEMGFHLFQGFFFSKPMIVGKSSANRTGTKIQYARLLNELKKEEPSYQVLAEIIEQDVSLAYKLMKVVSSRSGDDVIYSIKRALTYMGLKEIERWIGILMIQDLCSEKPEELMTLSLMRTRFAEKIAKHTELKMYRHEASLLGLFSTLDAMLDEPMHEALKDIALPHSIKDVLIREKGILLPICILINAYEMGDWDAASKMCQKLKLDETVLLEDYIEAVRWAGETLKKMS
ncbi:EAL and HDOD domain-containing protein [Fusibacter ferrireducens]|uniref:EAL domain-containing protein n=1 Tax=Fusibacter ferrireducens TaxID=2785058 RepID=A0ABR9ZQZ4_9FIRM|nr:EAL domain-containing protein [Fusibacter ferrireducens]MBF4692870.1 EAL domain-containing protein [Fusibacter ferrireducens]